MHMRINTFPHHSKGNQWTHSSLVLTRVLVFWQVTLSLFIWFKSGTFIELDPLHGDAVATATCFLSTGEWVTLQYVLFRWRQQWQQESIPIGCEPSAYQPYRDDQGQGQRGSCTLRSNALWVMVTWYPCLWADRHDWKHYLPSTSLVSFNNDMCCHQRNRFEWVM